MVICVKDTDHKVKRIYVHEFGANEANVVYWCERCGSIQVKQFCEYNGAGAENFYQFTSPTYK